MAVNEWLGYVLHELTSRLLLFVFYFGLVILCK